MLGSRVLAVDETPIKAGRAGPRKLNASYFWPLYGDADEVSFTYAATRGRSRIEATLAEHFTGTLITDGYAAYARYADARPGVAHAQCWAHTRRYFERALDSGPQAQQALALIGEIYRQEAQIKDKSLAGPAKQAARSQRGEPAVRAFWQWCDRQCQRLDLEPRHPLAKAIAYALARKAALEIFLADPDVPIDTNHLERGLRPIPMGRNYVQRSIMRSPRRASACRRRLD